MNSLKAHFNPVLFSLIFSLSLVVIAATRTEAVPLPEIKANCQDGSVAISPTDTLSISIELLPQDRAGEDADWWVLAATPLGPYYYHAASDSWRKGEAVAYQGPLFELSPHEIPDIANLAKGDHTITFQVDTTMNGIVDTDVLYSDSVLIRIKPAAPGNLIATAISSSQIDLTWQDNSDNEQGFRIWRYNPDEGSVMIEVGAETGSYRDTSLSPNTEYSYNMLAFNSGGVSEYSNDASSTTYSSYCDEGVCVDVSANIGNFKNIAGGVHFNGRTILRKRFIEEVGTNFFEMTYFLHDVLELSPGEYTNFPIDTYYPEAIEALLDDMEYIKSRQGKILLRIAGIPKWLSSVPNDERVFTIMPNYAKYPPNNYQEWADLISAAVTDLRQRGFEFDYYEIFGEVDLGSTWYKWKMPCYDGGEIVFNCELNELGHSSPEVLENFYKIYNYTARGVKAANPDVKVGGSAIWYRANSMWWTRFLLQNIKDNSLPLDFLSWHAYGTDRYLSNYFEALLPGFTIEDVYRRHTTRFREEGFSDTQIEIMVNDIYNYYKALKQQGEGAVRYPYSFVGSQFRNILNEEGFPGTKLLLNEWSIESMFGKFSQEVVDRRNDTHYAASFITRGLIDITDSEIEAQSYFQLSQRKLFDFDNGYGGRFLLFTQDGSDIPKASFNAFKLFAMLGDGVRLQTENTYDDIYAIATGDENSVSLLTTYFVFNNDEAIYTDADYSAYDLSKDVTLKIRNITFPNYTYKIYLIDRDYSNSFYGHGPELEIIESGSSSGDFVKEITLPVYGVVMIKIEKSDVPISLEP